MSLYKKLDVQLLSEMDIKVKGSQALGSKSWKSNDIILINATYWSEA